MGEAKNIRVEPISSKDASRIIRLLHYSGKVAAGSQLHLGVFLNGRCGGAMQFGPSLDKRKLIGLVKGTDWYEFLELNRMAFADWLPRNSESRALGYAMRFIRKKYPALKWVVSYADACQCGDGTIYRASGFVLTDVRLNKDLRLMPDGSVQHSISQRVGKNRLALYARTRGAARSEGVPLEGHTLRYLFFLHPEERKNLTVPELPFSEIEKRGARMYRGKKISAGEGEVVDPPLIQRGEDGSNPIPRLNADGPK